MLWCYALLGVSVLAKGPPGITVVGRVGFFHVVLLGRWRALYDGEFEIKRGLLLMIVIFLPWHIGMYLKEGVRFIDEYLFTHILNRAAVGVDNSPGTFEYYTSTRSATACGCGPRCCRLRSPRRSCARAPTAARAACGS